MQLKGPYGILTFLNFIDTNINRGISAILGVYWGLRASLLVRCGKFCIYLELCPKYTYLDSDLIMGVYWGVQGLAI